MKAKIACILVVTLLIATALPAVGTMTEINEKSSGSTFIKNQEGNKENIQSLHDLEVEWEDFYGGSNEDIFRNIKQTDDGGYIAVGVWNSEAHWLVRLDADGNEVWNVSALPNPDKWPRCYIVEQTNDGGFVTAGCHEEGTWGYDRCIWKVDENGVTEFCKVYDDPLNGYHMCIQETSDGGFIVSGEVDITPSDWDVFLMKTDSEGNVIWQKIHRFGEYGDNAYAVRETLDGGYILTGRLETDYNIADFHAIKTDSNGDVEWHKSYGGPGWDQSNSNDILLANDGGYYFLAETRSFGAGNLDIWLIKTDANGNMEWNKTFGRNKLDLCGGMDFTDDGGIIIAGTIDLNSFTKPKAEGILIKTDLNGNLEWQQIFGHEKEDAFQGVCSTSDGGYIVAGHTDSTDTHGAGEFDGWSIKMKAFENNPPDTPSKPSGNAEGEPGTDYIFSTSCTDPDGDDLLFKWDWDDGNFSDWLDTTDVSHNWSERGNYFVKVMAKDEHGRESDWSETHEINIPRPRSINRSLFNLFKDYARLFTMLKMILQRLGV
jgi:hypothetical protein